MAAPNVELLNVRIPDPDKDPNGDVKGIVATMRLIGELVLPTQLEGFTYRSARLPPNAGVSDWVVSVDDNLTGMNDPENPIARDVRLRLSGDGRKDSLTVEYVDGERPVLGVTAEGSFVILDPEKLLAMAALEAAAFLETMQLDTAGDSLSE